MGDKRNYFSCVYLHGLSYISLALVITLVVSYLYGLYYLDYLSYPLGYQADGLFTLAVVQMSVDGNLFLPFSGKLGYPEIRANLLDYYPIPERLFFALWWILAKLTSVFASANIIQVLAHVLPGLSFFYVAKRVSSANLLTFTLSVAYGLAPFIFARGLGHATVGWIFLLPLQVYVLLCLASGQCRTEKYDKTLFIVITAASACLNVYYFLMYLQFLFIFLLREMVRRERRSTLRIFFLLFLAGVVFAISNSPYIYETFTNGSVSLRNLASMELYALKLPELFLPAGYHKISIFSELAQRFYYAPSYIKGEVWSPYLGLVGVFGLLVLLGHQSFEILKRGPGVIHPLAFQILWVIFFSLVGGLNLILGVLQFQYLRATNRFSIWILTAALLYVCILATKGRMRSWIISSISILLALLMVLDLPFPFTKQHRVDVASLVDSDRAFVGEIESKINNPRALVLPAIVFPENGPVGKMLDYDPMRLYLNSNTLAISYGAPKFSGERVTDRLGLDEKIHPSDISVMISAGYNLVIFVKAAFENEFYESNVSILQSVGAVRIADSEYYSAFRLPERVSPSKYGVAEPLMRYTKGWSSVESSDTSFWRWAVSTKPILTIFSPSECGGVVFSGEIQSFGPERMVSISGNGGQTLWSGVVGQQKFPLTMRVPKSDAVIMNIVVSGELEKPAGDNRRLSISLHNVKLSCNEK